jgi:hypothetical protein
VGEAPPITYRAQSAALAQLTVGSGNEASSSCVHTWSGSTGELACTRYIACSFGDTWYPKLGPAFTITGSSSDTCMRRFLWQRHNKRMIDIIRCSKQTAALIDDSCFNRCSDFNPAPVLPNDCLLRRRQRCRAPHVHRKGAADESLDELLHFSCGINHNNINHNKDRHNSTTTTRATAPSARDDGYKPHNTNVVCVACRPDDNGRSHGRVKKHYGTTRCI